MDVIDRIRRPTAQCRRIAVIGAGPTGLACLERLLSVASSNGRARVEISIWDPRPPGQGVHSEQLPDYLPLNTAAHELQIYSGEIAGMANGTKGPDFRQFAEDRGFVFGAGSSDYLPRNLLGAYLGDAFDRVCRRASPMQAVEVVATEVDAIIPAIDGDTYLLRGRNGAERRVDHIFLCTGHGSPSAKGIDPTLGPSLPFGLDAAGSAEPVAIKGLGLTAIDTLSALTLGRGGHLRTNGTDVTYEASGLEPEIWMFSRSGLPFLARPVMAQGREKRSPFVLTRAKVDALRAQSGTEGKLCLRMQIMPLMALEMQLAMLETGSCKDWASSLAPLLDLRDPREQRLAAALKAILKEDASHTFQRIAPLSLPSEADGGRYADWFQDIVRRDLCRAAEGVPNNPVKSAAELFRDFRDIMRYIIDFEGLTEQSNWDNQRVYAPLMNRCVGGPDIPRARLFLALIKAGVVRLPAMGRAVIDGEPNNRRLVMPGSEQPVDIAHVFSARVPSTGLIGQRPSMLDDLHRQGLIRTFRSAPGLDGIKVDSASRALDRMGRASQSLSILGPPSEGSRYYNHYVTTAGHPCRLMRDVDAVARRIIPIN